LISCERHLTMRILYLLLLALLAIFVSGHDEIDCGKDCADFVTAKIEEEKASCRQAQNDLNKEHGKTVAAHDNLKNELEKTIASLKEEITTLESQTKKGSELEKELRQFNKDMEAKLSKEVEERSKEVEEHKAMLEKAQELVKKAHEQVFEANMEIKELTDRLGSTRINFKGISDDLAELWKKLVAAFKRNVDTAKEEEVKKPEL
jgi:chromosome segregation ATPase